MSPDDHFQNLKRVIRRLHGQGEAHHGHPPLSV